MREPLTRHACGFAIFNECDPATCQRQCFTARAIEINEKYRPQPPRATRLTLSLILAACVALFAWSASVGLGRAERAHQSEQRI